MIEILESILSQMSPQERFAFHSSGAYKVCEENNWGNPFVPGRSQEIVMANILGHEISETVSGPDAHDHAGPAEYKSCSPGINSPTPKKFIAVYAGISIFPTWEEQLEYLDRKILGYKNHYHARFQHGECQEIWVLDCQTIYNLLLPKLKNLYDSLKANKRTKDPRLRGDITKTEIYRYGKKVFEKIV